MGIGLKYMGSAIFLNVFMLHILLLNFSCASILGLLESKSSKEGFTLKVMAYNICHANPTSKGDSIDIGSIVKRSKLKIQMSWRCRKWM